MNIQGANPNIKAFLFFILVLASGLFSMILALYFDKIFPKVLQEKEIPANYYPSEAMKASLAPDFNSFDQVKSSNTSEMSSIYGSLTPAVEAFISVKSVDNGKAFHFVVNNSGDFTLRNIAAGPYELVIVPRQDTGLEEKRIDLIHLEPGPNSLGILEMN